MKNKHFFVILLCIFSGVCCAQNGYVTINQDPRVDSLIMKQKQIYLNDNTIDGFRIQIFMESGNDAVKHAEEVKAEFLQSFPDIPVYLVFGQPYYRLRVGDFRSRLEADKNFIEINKLYSNSFITAERINLPYNVLCNGEEDNDTQESLQDNDIQQDTIIN